MRWLFMVLPVVVRELTSRPAMSAKCTGGHLHADVGGFFTLRHRPKLDLQSIAPICTDRSTFWINGLRRVCVG